jgi:hypothetical protein
MGSLRVYEMQAACHGRVLDSRSGGGGYVLKVSTALPLSGSRRLTGRPA